MNFFRPSLSGSRPRRQKAFTLIEIMVVVAIIGLMAAIGIPSMLLQLKKEGMRKAVSDVKDVLTDARAKAILNNQITYVTFHPAEKKLESSTGKSATLDDNVDIAMLDINLMDFSQSEVARVRFFPNGTSDELMLVLISGGQRMKITLEFSTGIASSAPLTQ
ncbi:MAG TPA: type II secretion system protein [Verrucomicrobiae bacterium]|nr:type II secretion system protein [Verrucomicrobiae bacterium]